jgi:lysozyme family protein
MTPFHRALQRTLASEGYYTGSGPTYRGIDRRYWPGWEGWAIIDDWLAGDISVALCHSALVEPVEAFYRAQFWGRIWGDRVSELDEGVAMALFDFAVNSGVHAAVRALQASLNDLNRHGRTYADIAEDGVLGPRTLETLRRQLQTVYGGRLDNARKILLNRYTVERGVVMRGARDREDWPGWWLRLGWV